MTNAPAHLGAAQKSERIDGRVGREHFNPLKGVKRLENPQQRFHCGTPAAFQISQSFFGDPRFFSGGALIEIPGETEASELLTEDGLQLRDRSEGEIAHIGIILPIMTIFKYKR